MLVVAVVGCAGGGVLGLLGSMHGIGDGSSGHRLPLEPKVACAGTTSHGSGLHRPVPRPPGGVCGWVLVVVSVVGWTGLSFIPQKACVRIGGSSH